MGNHNNRHLSSFTIVSNIAKNNNFKRDLSFCPICEKWSRRDDFSHKKLKYIPDKRWNKVKKYMQKKERTWRSF